jgi:membrane associated rhomboid family serine protease
MNIIEEIKRRYSTGNIIEKLILVNIAVFVFALLMTVVSKLYNGNANFIMDWFALDDRFDSMFIKPWSIISYGFLHGGFLHILFNLIGLYFIGNLFLQYFSEKQLLNFYLLGTFFGGILYLLSQNYFPLFEGKTTYLVGASAGVSAIFVGVATYIPNYELKIRFIGYVKLWYLAAIWVGLDVLGLIGTNAGGNFAHLGGALFGFLYVYKASNKEITILDQLGNLFKRKEKPLKTVYKSKENKKEQSNVNLNQKQIDEILDKISKSGYDTLTKSEKEFLFKQGKK